MTAERKPRITRRLGLFGDLPSRLLRHSLGIAPWFLEPVLVPVWTFGFFLIAKQQRRAIQENLRALHPGWSPSRCWRGAFRVFLSFAETHVDALRCETDTGEVRWRIDGREHFEALAARRDGCIVLTAHMGNYDLAAPLFSGRFGRTLFAVRAPEREPELQAIRAENQRLAEERHPEYRTLYNSDDKLLGVELARLLGEGNVVAVQGDRVVFEVAPMEVEVEPGLWMRLPKGPLFLARATGAAVYPLFIVRDGWRRYRVIVFPELELPPRRRGDDSEAARVWAQAILRVVREHWAQWHVFEPVLRRKS